MTRNEIINFAKKHKIDLSITWWEDDGEIWLNRLIIPDEDRNKGYGSKILDMLKQYCNERNICIKLLADSCYGSEINRLVNFYKRFGFEPYKERTKSKKNPQYLKYTPTK